MEKISEYREIARMLKDGKTVVKRRGLQRSAVWKKVLAEDLHW